MHGWENRSNRWVQGHHAMPRKVGSLSEAERNADDMRLKIKDRMLPGENFKHFDNNNNDDLDPTTEGQR